MDGVIYRTKEDGFLLVAVLNGTEGVVFLIDLWKVGIRDFQEFKGGLQGLRRSLGMSTLEFHRIEKEEGKRLLRQGYEISKLVDLEIPQKVITWLEDNDILEGKLLSTVYTCFNCETGNLTYQEINEILSIARKEIEKELIGTEGEEQYYYICESCKGDMHKAHSEEETDN